MLCPQRNAEGYYNERWAHVVFFLRQTRLARSLPSEGNAALPRHNPEGTAGRLHQTAGTTAMYKPHTQLTRSVPDTVLGWKGAHDGKTFDYDIFRRYLGEIDMLTRPVE